MYGVVLHNTVHVCYSAPKNLHLAAIYSHLTIIFLNKLMVYGVVQQVYGVVTPDSVIKLQFCHVGSDSFGQMTCTMS